MLIAVMLILKLISLMYWTMNPKKGVEKGRKSIFLSVIESNWFSSFSIASIAFVRSFH
jgi:hypothetical protein